MVNFGGFHAVVAPLRGPLRGQPPSYTYIVSVCICVSVVVMSVCMSFVDAKAWIYNGCYVDTVDEPLFDFVISQDGTRFLTTIDSCKYYAESIGSSVIGYHSRGECWSCKAGMQCDYERHGRAERCAVDDTLHLHIFSLNSGADVDFCDSTYPYDCDLAAGRVDVTRLTKSLNTGQTTGFKCSALMKEVIDSHTSQIADTVNSAPTVIPEQMKSKFTMDGEVPVVPWFIGSQTAAAANKSIVQRSMTNLPLFIRQNYCYKRHPFLCESLSSNADLVDRYIRNKSGIVFGSQEPWLESTLLFELGAAHVSTVEYFPIISMNVAQLSAFLPSQIASLYLAGSWGGADFAASFSSFEHSGLGRYGDPLDPDGDLKAMAVAHCLLKKNGILFLSVPVGRDTVYFNAHRQYGRIRLPLLLSGWELLEVIGTLNLDNVVALTTETAILVLRKVD
jgi:hypothetical protein